MFSSTCLRRFNQYYVEDCPADRYSHDYNTVAILFEVLKQHYVEDCPADRYSHDHNTVAIFQVSMTLLKIRSATTMCTRFRFLVHQTRAVSRLLWFSRLHGSSILSFSSLATSTLSPERLSTFQVATVVSQASQVVRPSSRFGSFGRCRYFLS